MVNKFNTKTAPISVRNVLFEFILTKFGCVIATIEKEALEFWRFNVPQRRMRYKSTIHDVLWQSIMESEKEE